MVLKAFLNSSNTLSFDNVSNSSFKECIISNVLSSTSNSNSAANLATLYTLRGSSLKPLLTAFILFSFKSFSPLNGSIISPVNTSCAIAFIVISRLFKSSSIVILLVFILKFLCPKPVFASVLAIANSLFSNIKTENALPCTLAFGNSFKNSSWLIPVKQ